MKQKVLFSLVALFCLVQVMATNLVIERYTGAEMAKDIALIGKWVFVGEDLQLLDKAGNVLATEPIANIHKIVFSNESTALENVVKYCCLSQSYTRYVVYQRNRYSDFACVRFTWTCIAIYRRNTNLCRELAKGCLSPTNRYTSSAIYQAINTLISQKG